MRKYCGIFRTALANQLEYRVNFISSFLFSLVPFGVNTLLWIAAARGNDGMPLGTEGIVTYYFTTLIVSNITSTTSIFRISDDIRLGNLSQYLLKPYNYALYQLMTDMPQRAVFVVMNAVPLAVIYALLRRYILPHPSGISVSKAAIFAAFLLVGYLINFLVDFSISLYSFYFSRVSSLYTSIRVLRNISAGIVFPLMLLPEAPFTFLIRLPFAYTNYIPTTFLMGMLSERAALSCLSKAAGWALFLAAGCAVRSSAPRRRGDASPPPPSSFLSAEAVCQGCFPAALPRGSSIRYTIEELIRYPEQQKSGSRKECNPWRKIGRIPLRTNSAMRF